MYHKMRSLQTENYHQPALTLEGRVVRSPIDSPVTPWSILPASELFTNQYRCKQEFLSLSHLIINKLGMPTSVCLLADTIIGVSNWQSVSIEEQYLAIGQSAAVFEASSMSYLNIKGPDAEHVLNKLTPRSIQRLKPAEAMFTIFTTHLGTVDDDALILRISEDEFLLSCGGSKLPQHTLTYLPMALKEFPNAIISVPDMVSFNIKGPQRTKAMLHLLDTSDKSKVTSLNEFEFCQARTLNGEDVWIVKTKIGMEMWGKPRAIEWAWNYMLDHREIYTPCGWDVLHTFRMECEELLLSVYPFDIHDATSLWDIGYGWMTYEKESHYIGQEVLAQGKVRQTVQLKKIHALSSESPPAKVGSVLQKENGDFVGYITSSAFSIKAERAIAFAHLLMNVDCSDTFYLKGTPEAWRATAGNGTN